ncbi:GyrI-like domain-containing protein [Ferrimonas sp. YFM]|uniref:AraC family transcriptional regulator n=1 Tax=Ferrimonas sp. YFM TaxID=3028878 RepID=UPI0025727299|nr:GyrI-like domain-containing protein [Ferrimonas sp. YFM]BDY06959.1 DNA gyrase inhibitor [Ferrimonas sp. YFM]
MSVDYPNRLKPVIRHLENNLAEPMNLTEVAAMAHLSPYHFHRIFKAVTGETLDDFRRRLRLESVACALFYHKGTVTQLALEHGFSSSQSLSKAFRRHFGLTPSEVNRCTCLEQLSELLQNSKIGHRLRKKGHATSGEEAYHAGSTPQWSCNMEMKHFEPASLAAIRVTGPYGDNYEEPCGRLFQWAGMQGLTEAPCLFIYHDNPEITPAEHCRTDICLMVPEGLTLPQWLERKPFPGGRYATLRREITDKAQYPRAWEELIGQVVQAGIQVDERPCFEWYHSVDPTTHKADVSFCSAVVV